MDARFEEWLEDEDSAARYVAAKIEGQSVIRGRWRMLAEETRTALVDSGFYSLSGERRDLDSPATSLPQHDADRLEQAVGRFKLCLAATLPLATAKDPEKGSPIPHEAHTDEVMHGADALLLVRDWQDPVFLRLALRAVIKHQQANALCMYRPESTFAPAWGWIGALFKAALMLAMPVALAAGLVASVRQDVGGAALAFYLVGFGVLAILSTAGIGAKKKDGFELAYGHWTRFQLNDWVGVTGAGALERLRQMVQDGVNVPSVAFDMAETLRCRSAGRFSESIRAEPAEIAS
ncbi:hypothetical protein [Caenimonas soli]|uniref:hypothetical protein n=1 Tax=Caenimonas soli TaxID=2735555 RepID=UPI001554DA89|nr:hypothetical protein [Caenimonas soli]NPC57845.1 hypothetical protein [Caenimonas soli]